MKIIAAPNAFKGSMSAKEAAEAISEGVLRVIPDCEVVCVPVADGGDGLAEIATDALGGKDCLASVHGPLMEDVRASFGYVDNTGVAIVEMANASGLSLLSDDQLNPMKTSTYGTGELILAAMAKGATRIIVGLGGSATCDGGIGMASALGYRFLDINGNELPPIGQSLRLIHTINDSHVNEQVRSVKFEGVCDVTNPLTGANGASYVYSPQKGADEDQVRLLDEGLLNLANVIQRDLGVTVNEIAGGGAAGGLGAGLHCFLGADLRKGIDLVLDLVAMKEKIQGADLVITGEGQIDYQTKFDKAPIGVARLAMKNNIRCIAVCGGIGERIDELYEDGIDSVFSICAHPIQLEKAMTDARQMMVNSVEQIIRLYTLNSEK